MIGSQVKEREAPAVAAPAPPTADASAQDTGDQRRFALDRARLDRLRRFFLADPVRVPLVCFLLSRAYVFLLGAIAMHINVGLPPVAALGYFMPELEGLARYLLQPWRNWDGHWYALIAREGYAIDQSVTAFYPLYPLLLRWGAQLLGGRLELAGVLISSLSFLGALFVLYRLIEFDFSAAVARRTLLYLSLFPTSFFFSAVYNESLFLLLAVACWYSARRDRWWLAGAFGFLAALTRVHGALLLFPLVILFVRQQGLHPLRWQRNPASITLVPAGLMVYMAYLRRTWDDPLVMVRAQKGWDRYSANPFETLRTGIRQVNGCALRDQGLGVDFCWKDQLLANPGLDTLRDMHWRWGLAESNLIELVATILLIVLGLAALHYLPLAYSSYLAAGIVLPLWSPSIVHALMSMHRFTLVLFPAFVVLALLGRRPVVHVAIVVVSALLTVFFVNQFASWIWVA